MSTIGNIVTRTDIASTRGPFRHLQDEKVRYPPAVVQTLMRLYMAYNTKFGQLVELNREWDTDYACCHPLYKPVNWAVQIDMVGLTDELLSGDVGYKWLKQQLHSRIFEIENSVAMYQLLMMLFDHGQGSFFGRRFLRLLDEVRSFYGRPVVLLAVTDQKLEAMRQEEFGKVAGAVLTDHEVRARSGFDALWGPDDFRAHLRQHGGGCQALLYVRASDPVSRLRNPGTPVVHPLLSDPKLRQIIKANSLTMNIDNPDWSAEDPRRINDTKAYMPKLQLAFPAWGVSDLLSDWCNYSLDRGGMYDEVDGNRLSVGLYDYLKVTYGDALVQAAERGEISLRAKPMTGSYGCYGHLTGNPAEGRFRRRLREGIRQRGPYVIQPELNTPVVLMGGEQYTFIDRAFLGMVGREPTFLGGVRNFIPLSSVEAQKGRIHGNSSAVYAEIVA